MTPVEDFLPGVLPLVPGCPIPVATHAVVNAAILFCEDSNVVRESLDSFVTSPGQARYELDVPAQQSTARILQVTVNGRAIGMYPVSQAPAQRPGIATPTVAYTSMQDGILEVVMHPTPDRTYDVAVEVALRPSRKATRVNSTLFEDWYRAICHGAVAEIAAIPDQPFSNPPLAMHASSMFLRETTKAKNESYKGKVRANLTVRPRRFI